MNKLPYFLGGMMESEKEIPRCPKCGEALETIHGDDCGTLYDWNNEDGHYEVDDAQLSMTFYCMSCGNAIGGWRGDGENWGFIPETE
jgi:hypothetical protein